MSRQPRKVPVIDRDVALYLAGLIDGEGCFHIARNKKRSKNPHYCYCPQFRIVLTDESTIKWMADKLQRNYGKQRSKVNSNQKETYEIRISDRVGLVTFIEQIIPFMIKKKDTAQTMLDFCKSRIENWPKNNYERKYNKLEMNLYDKIKLNNRVGVFQPAL